MSLPSSQAVILVVGATGGVGSRVVKKLLAKGMSVRCLVRNKDQAKKMLGDQPEYYEADLTIKETLNPEIMQNVIAVICCSGTKVQPKEGDSPTREKYYQGIKFYLPEVVDVPELVEYEGIKNLIDLVKPRLPNQGELMLFDFANPDPSYQELWGALDDVVMGGVSESSIRFQMGVAIFSGMVSTANSGGFASVRSRNFTNALDLSNYEGIILRVKGDGKRYKFLIRGETKWDGVGYSYSYDTIPDTWIDVKIPFSQLIPVFRAKTISGQQLNSKAIFSFQFMLSKFEYDGGLNPNFNPGYFELQIASIKAYSANIKPQFIHISSAGVTRPGRPGINLDEEPPAVRLNDQLGGILTWKLRGEEVIKASKIPYTIIRPCALTQATGGDILYFSQGDNIRGQVSREDIADLVLVSLDSPAVVNTTFEVNSTMQSGQNNWGEIFKTLVKDL